MSSKTPLLTYLIWDHTTYKDNPTNKHFLTVADFQAFAAGLGREPDAPDAWAEWQQMEEFYK